MCEQSFKDVVEAAKDFLIHSEPDEVDQALIWADARIKELEQQLRGLETTSSNLIYYV